MVLTTPQPGATTQTRRLIRSVLVLSVVAATLIGAAYVFGYRLNLQTRSVPVPDASAAPDQVVLAYVDAYNHRDFATMTAIYPSAQTAFSRTRAMGTMRDVEIIRSSPATAAEVAGRSTVAGQNHYRVQVSVDYTGLTGSDLAYDSGPNGWTYWLERANPTERWIITDHGNG